jgi:thiamine-phosphate pyrophosphorylase
LPDQPTSVHLADRLRVYLVADPDHVRGEFVPMVAAAVRGGVTAVQLRCKERTDREILSLAKELRTLTSMNNAMFLINDRLDIALACGADGLHLGVDDLPLAHAHRIAPHLVLGYSPETDDQAELAASLGAGYLGVGPVFGTATKPDAGDAIGLETISRRVRLAGIPVIGIGGITPRNSASVLGAGAVGVAVVSAISMNDDPEAAARSFIDSIR